MSSSEPSSHPAFSQISPDDQDKARAYLLHSAEVLRKSVVSGSLCSAFGITEMERLKLISDRRDLFLMLSALMPGTSNLHDARPLAILMRIVTTLQLEGHYSTPISDVGAPRNGHAWSPN
jgi:hypothetical protein